VRSHACGVGPDLGEAGMRRAIYAIGAAAFLDRATLAWAADPSADAAWRSLLDRAGAWAAPALPINGDDAVAAGAQAGPAVGAALREVEAWWVAADFPDDRAAALARLQAIVRGEEPPA